MKILMVASEGTPFAKTGGLADVIGALPAALAARGEEVGVVLPLYRSAQSAAERAERVYDRLNIRMRPDRTYQVSIRRMVDRNVRIFFVDAPLFFDRASLYGEGGSDYPDNHIRFAVLCRAALGIVRALFRPDVIHCHDWQSGLIGPMMRHQFRTDPTFMGIRLLMTIHNLGYQGQFGPEALDDIGLSRDLFERSRMEFWGGINFLKGGIVYSDAISTVSTTYASEIQTPEQGFGLDGLLRSRSDVLSGILNGVDYGEWDPRTDAFIAAPYSAEDLTGKQVCKRDLLRIAGLPDNPDRPVIGIVSRFVHQKGFDLIEEIAGELLSRNVSIVALGSGEPRFEAFMRSLADRYPDKVSVTVAYNNELAHKIEAGSDIFLMPSRYEPGGLNQIYSLRYGTVPVVRATGGLADTIDDSTGFRFNDYNGRALMEALSAALTAFEDGKRWRTLMVNGMNREFSWSEAAGKYLELYRGLLAV